MKHIAWSQFSSLIEHLKDVDSIQASHLLFVVCTTGM